MGGETAELPDQGSLQVWANEDDVMVKITKLAGGSIEIKIISGASGGRTGLLTKATVTRHRWNGLVSVAG